MTLRHTITLSLAAAFIAAGFVAAADAKTMHVRHTHSHAMHMASSHGHMHGTASSANADHSADALNAQSLSRAQGATQ